MTHLLKKLKRLDALNYNEPEATGVHEKEQPPSASLKVKESIKKEGTEKQIPPAQIGIQRLR